MEEKGDERIYIYYIPSDGKAWADFLHSKLSEKEYMISSSIVNIHTLTDDHLIHDVNIVLVSPDFLNLKGLKPLNVLHQYKSLAVLLGITKSEYDEFLSRNSRSLLCEWEVFCTEATEDSVRKLLLRIIMLYEDVHQHDVKIREHSVSFYGDEDDYDFLPEARPIIGKSKTFQRETNLYEIRERPRTSQASDESRGDRISQTSDYDLPQEEYDIPPPACTRPTSRSSETAEQEGYAVPNLKPKPVVPKKPNSRASADVDNSLYGVLQNFSNKREVFLLLDRKAQGDVIVTSDTGDKIAKATFLDKKIYRFTAPGQKLKAKIMLDDRLLGRCEGDFSSRASAIKLSDESSRLQNLRTLLMDETDPICVLCKALRLTERSTEALDRALAERWQTSTAINSLSSIIKNEDRHSQDSSDEVWPTLFHFCAEYNLVNFFRALSEVPGIAGSCSVLNCNKEDPLQIARKKNHVQLAKLIESYVPTKDPQNKKDSGIVCEEAASRDSEYMDMSEEAVERTERKADTGVSETSAQEPGPSEYMVMNAKPGHYVSQEETPPPVPPKAHEVPVKHKYVNVRERGEQYDDAYMEPRTEDPFLTEHLSQLHLKHSRSEGDAQHLTHLGLAARDIDIDEMSTSSDIGADDTVFRGHSTYPGYYRTHSESQVNEEHKCQSLTQGQELQLPTQKDHKKGIVKKFGNFLKNIGHHEHGHGENRQRRHSKQLSPSNSEESVLGGHHTKDERRRRPSLDSRSSNRDSEERRKSMRIHLALNDKNIKVMDMPGRGSTFYDNKSQF